MKKIKNKNGPYHYCYHFQCGERHWVAESFATDKDINKELRSLKNCMAMIDVYDKESNLVYSKYHQ